MHPCIPALEEQSRAEQSSACTRGKRRNDDACARLDEKRKNNRVHGDERVGNGERGCWKAANPTARGGAAAAVRQYGVPGGALRHGVVERHVGNAAFCPRCAARGALGRLLGRPVLHGIRL